MTVNNRRSLDPNVRNPLVLANGDVWPYTVYLKNVIAHPKIIVGDYTYYSDPNNPPNYAQKLAPYLYPESLEKLIIGKYVQIAYGVQFITSSANHQMDGFSTFPFALFGGVWAQAYQANYASKGDTVIGHDVWIGHEAVIMPGVQVGSGAIIGARAVVTKNVSPYTIVGGSPAQIIKKRFDDDIIKVLLEIAWWDWPVEKVTKYLPIIVGCDIEQLRSIAKVSA